MNPWGGPCMHPVSWHAHLLVVEEDIAQSFVIKSQYFYFFLVGVSSGQPQGCKSCGHGFDSNTAHWNVPHGCTRGALPFGGF